MKNLVIKEFPTGSLTVNGLKAYLDMLENSGFVPDLLIVDYVDLMKLPSDDNYRIALGQIFKDTRGIAVESNMAVVTVSQSNRDGAKGKKVTGANVAEDWSKIGTADTIITYSQTDEERNMNLARIYVANARNDQDKITILISQNYAMNQFCKDSYLMDDAAAKLLNTNEESE
jgi:replicative DNA helicase